MDLQTLTLQHHVALEVKKNFSTVARRLQEALETSITETPVDIYATLPKTSFHFETSGNLQPNARYKNLEYSVTGSDDFGLRDAEISMKDYFLGDTHHSHKVFSGQHHSYKQGQKVEQRTFVDLRLLRLRTGNGGNGCVSFFRDANRPVGPPDGGDGGDGGSIYVQVVNNISLQLDGKTGEDIILEVPVGTTMRWIPDPLLVKDQLRESGGDISKVVMGLKMTESHDIQLFRDDYDPGHGWLFKEKDEEYHRGRDFFVELDEQVKDYDREIIAEELMFDRFPVLGLDFDKPTEKPVLLMRGGKGGMGNMHFLTANVRNPRFSKVGRQGLCGFFLLELKLIADLGLVGLPNAGKLTLLRAISRATPRVGHWEFTTLQPTVGTISTSIDTDPFTVADIPGIIKGASENKGMGMDFLRHIERSGGLVFVVSLESKDPVGDLQVLMKEIGPKRMTKKRVMVIGTKADLVNNGGSYRALTKFVQDTNAEWQCIPVCAPRGENIKQCVRMMAQVAKGKDQKDDQR
ncbi:CIC11C00000003277 [Sungouiella intermedia]|uniref:CIC11C00000003277 n=1 Tax=Sungouiella intermedia TaxID=45354 RepID=A0A1L0DUC6_9ASCO|nr:CIC11C00000003277 [[Candida] intermedia]